MRVLALLPARLDSVRIHQKLLKKINNIPIILHTAFRTKLCNLIDDVIICTDSKEISKLCKKNNFRTLFTKKNLSNGTERIASIINKIKADLIIDVHADEAILNPNNLAKLIKFHKKNLNKFDIVVPHKKNKSHVDKNVVKLIFLSNKKVIYFSRSAAPFHFRSKNKFFFHHLDYISFKPTALKKFKKFKIGELEKIEGIELLRAIENELKIGTFEIKTDTFSINTKNDLRLARKKFKEDKFFNKYFEKVKK